MSFIIILALYPLTSALLSWALKFLKNPMFLDVPTERSNHQTPKPRGAGIILIPLILFSTSVIFLLEDTLNNNWKIIFGFCLLLSIVSLLDDVKNISAKIRLTFQIFCVFSSLYLFKDQLNIFIRSSEFLIIFNGIESLGLSFVFCFLVMLWVWIINMFNFMDGMDGITSVQISSLSILTNFLAILGLIEETFIYFSLILLTISFAFYSVNRPPSKIFLGDVGSIPIGFIAGFILIYNMIMYNLVFPFLIIMLYYIQDSIATIILRFFKKENVFQAHSSHFYQKILRKGYSHDYVLKKIIYLNAILLLLAILAYYYPLISFLLAFICTSSLLIFFNSRKPK